MSGWTRNAAIVAVLMLAGTAPGRAQVVVTTGEPQVRPTVQQPPSVDAGIADGVVKHAGAPSVGNGIANGVVKQPGAPSVDNGAANGSAKSLNLQQ